MPSLLDLRRRIRSVKNTQQVTKAMKMVSAAKLRRAQERVVEARPYAAMFRQMLADVSAAVAGDEKLAAHPLLARRPERRILAVLLTSDRGLAGAFNANLIRAAQAFVSEHRGAEVSLMLLGRKGRDFFRKRGGRVALERTGISESGKYADAAEIGRDIIGRFER
jgi:F-type H+-transporting ATPase subunit gamma